VIFDRDGYIVTNNHVIDGASEFAIALPDGTLHMTRVVGTDPESDIALLKVDADGLRPITAADIDHVAVGDVVLAVGNPLGVGQRGNARRRQRGRAQRTIPVENFIQTDAAINPGVRSGKREAVDGQLAPIPPQPAP